ncbi:MAG: protein kinase domain-containing protein [Pirellulaceae bacterium]
MSSHPAEDSQPNLALSEQAASATETVSLRHEFTPRVPGVESTRSLQGAQSLDSEGVPQHIGRYRVQRMLGQGSFGRVWLAMDDELQRQVAIKVLFPSRLPGIADGEAWLTEARALAALDHPHIVPIFDVGRTEDGSVFAVAKFIPGKTLQQELQDRPAGRMDPAEAVSIVAPLAEALQHAHERNLIHRDVKPANVLIERTTGRVYLADFGLAARRDGAESKIIVGTPAYMSPEQARCETVDARSDLFSLGIILYELLAGRRPFSGSTLDELLQKVRSGDFLPLREIDDSIPAELERVCHKAIAKDPERRYEHGRDFAADLRAWEQEELRMVRQQTAPNNLSASSASLIGRDEEVAQVQSRLAATRLLTLTGPGGIGKTRLALHAAAGLLPQFADGVFVVELAPLTDPALVPAAIAQAVGCRTYGQRAVVEDLLDWLSSRQILLVLDNFEHLPAANEHVSRLLTNASGLKVLVTSRAPLRIAGEQEFPVSLLTLPDLKQLPGAEKLADYSAVSLFVERAREVLPGFELTSATAAAIAEICVRLDGLPLAIELAAARSKILAPQDLLARLQKSLQVLSTRRSDAPERQQTLRQAIQWSYELLTQAERQLFRRLAVFSGGFTLDAAEQVVADERGDITDGLASLADNSLLRVERAAHGGRLNMLETVRVFAREMLLSSGEAEELGRRHAAWVVALVEAADPELRGPKAGEFTQRLEQEHPNICAALAWSLMEPKDATRGELGLRIGGAMWRFWCSSGHLREADGWLDRLLTAFASTHTDSIGALARYAAGCVAEDLGKYFEARKLYEEARRLWEAAGDERHLPDAYIALGSILSSQGDYPAAKDFFGKALELSRRLGDRRLTSVALSNLGSIAWSSGDYDKAKDFQQEALDIRRQLGNRAGVAVSLTSLGLIASRQGNLPGAKLLYLESLAILRETENKMGVAVCLNNLGEISYRLGEFESGEAMLWEALHIQHDLGDRLSLAYTLESIAAAAQWQGSSEAAVRFFAAAEALRESLGAPLPPLEKANNDQIIQEVRIALGPERFAAMWTAAKTVPLEKLVAEGRK